VPLVMMGYGRTDAVDGSVFPYAFPLVTTYQMQASAIVKFLATKNGGSLAGKKIVYLYHDSAYGKEPSSRWRPSQARQVQPGQIPVAHPGNEQGAQWLQDPPGEARLRDLLGLGRDEPDRAQGRAEGRLPARQDDRVVVGRFRGRHRAGRRCRQGLHGATWNVAGKNVPVIADIEKVVYGAGKGNMQDATRSARSSTTAACRRPCCRSKPSARAQEKFGKGKAMTGDTCAGPSRT
jgi:branched-chain amino acid transport system substrate-binding protein